MLELCDQGYILLFTRHAKVKIRHARFATEQVQKNVWTEFKILDGSAFSKPFPTRQTVFRTGLVLTGFNSFNRF